MSMRRVILRLCRSRPPPPLHFFCHYSSFSSHSLFSSSPYHHHHHWQRNYSPWSSLALQLFSSHDRLSVSRGFFTQPHSSESDDAILPVQAVISLLDSYHDFTGFPWWIVISSSTVALRLALFPLIVAQLKKLKRIGELLPKLPPPFPPPLSGRSFRKQIALFWKEKEAAGCPSVLWFFSSFVVQVPCFFLMVTSFRRMSLDHHPGFDCGGILWFQNLTEYPHGVLGPIFPFLIAGLHLTNTQGSLVYWLTNSSLSLIQLLCLTNPNVLDYLGLPRKNAAEAPTNKERGQSGVADIVILTKQGATSVQSLSPAELVSYSVEILTDGRRDTAVRLLRLALEKDPGYVRALLILGQTLLQNKQFAEAAGCLESAISKLLVAGYPTTIEEVDFLILSSIWAGIANVQQGKMQEGLVHLERIAQLEEPEDANSKALYYDGLIILSSALLTVDRKAEALEYWQKIAAYNVYLDHLETNLKDFASDLASSRRRF